MKQIAVRKFPTGYGWPIVSLRQTALELSEAKGITFEDDLDDLGELKCAALWNVEVGQLYLEARPHPVYNGVTIYVDGDVNRTRGVWAIQDELGVSVKDFAWLTESERSPIHRGEPGGQLSARESEVAAALSSGKATNEIAKELRIAPSTVSGHLQRIYLKLGVHSRAELRELLRRQPNIARSA